MDEILNYLERWEEDLSGAGPVPVYRDNGEESELYFPHYHYKLGFRQALEECFQPPHEELERSLVGLQKEDIPYFVERLVERSEDQRISIRPIDHSYALEWEAQDNENASSSVSSASGVQYGRKRAGTEKSKSKFNRLRSMILHSSLRKDDSVVKTLIDNLQREKGNR